MTTPAFGFPYPTLGQPPSVPADMEALAEAVDTALVQVQDTLAAPYASSLRANTDQVSPGSFVSLGFSATIGTAPRGVYLVTWNIIISTVVADQVGYLRITANGTNLNGDARSDAIDTTQHFGGAMPYLHSTDSSLAVTAFYQAATGNATVYADSMLSVLRIGDAP